MKFNKITRGAKRQMNDEQTVYEILDASCICHLSFVYQNQPMIIPTAYGRAGDTIFLHGSRKNFMLNQITDGQTVCLSVTLWDGVVLARNLFHSSVNYRSAVLFGKAREITDLKLKSKALTVICENIIKGRSEEVPLGSEQEIENTMVIAFEIESASAKVRTGGPLNDEHELAEVWSGYIPLELKAGEPVQDMKFGRTFEFSESVRNYIKLRS